VSTATDRLEELLDGEEPEATNKEGHRWEITDLGGADWAMRKVAKLDAEAREVTDTADRQLRAIETWREAEYQRLQNQRGRFEALLADYHRRILAKDKKAKTIRLPHGVLTARKLPDNVQILDEDEVLEWAKDQGNEFVIVVPVEYRLDRSAVKAAVLKAGEIIPGVTPIEGEVRFQVVSIDPFDPMKASS
jgi:phage host-nuclease inhibitor protein Gam